MLIVTLLLAVLQVAVYVHVRNVVTASAQEGARYAANADVDSGVGCGADGGGRRPGDVGADRRGAGLHVGRGGRPQRADARRRPLLRCRCPRCWPSLGNLLPLEVTGRAVKEARVNRLRAGSATGARLGAGGVRLHRAGRVRAAGLHRRRVLGGAARGVRLDRGGAGGRPGDGHGAGPGDRSGARAAGGAAGGRGPVGRRHRRAGGLRGRRAPTARAARRLHADARRRGRSSRSASR